MPSKYDIQDPSKIFSDIISDRVGGDKQITEMLMPLFWYKGIVVDIDEVGKTYDKINPPRSIKVKVLSPFKFTEEKILYPISDFDKTPIAIGETVLFVFGNEDLTFGYWLNRIPTGVTTKVKAVEYYTTEPTRNDDSAQAFGDVPTTQTAVTEEGMLYESQDYNQTPDISKDDDLNNDRKVSGRKDNIVLKSDGTFEIGEDATKHTVYGEDLNTWLTDPNAGKITTIKSSLEILLFVLNAITLILNAILLLPILDPASKAALSPLVNKFNDNIKKLNANLPLLDQKGDVFISDTVKVK